MHYRGRIIRAGGQGFAGLARKRLLHILQQRAFELGVELRFEVEANDEDLRRRRRAGDRRRCEQRDPPQARRTFGTTLETRRNRYIWLGTRQRFDAFTFAFEETPYGWFQVHAYQFEPETGTVIVECREETWRAAGLDRASTAESLAFCERLFGRYLGGHGLMSNAHAPGEPVDRVRAGRTTRAGSTATAC